MMVATRLAAAIVLVSAAGALAACSDGGQLDKAGGPGGPLTLSLGTVNPAGRPESAAIERFAAAVKRLSGASIRVRIVWAAAGDSGTEQSVAQLLREGKLDAAVIASRVWDLEGVTSLQALQAPFLIDSQALETRIATGPLATEMLAGLRKDGVTGLALLPAQLLHPFGFAKPLRGPLDFADAGFRAAPSRATDLLLHALGARRSSVNGDAFNNAVREGRLVGAEFYFEVPLPGRTTATGNVTFFPKVHTLVVRTGVLDALTAEQRGLLRRAAAETLQYVLRTNMPDTKAAADYCANGGEIVSASPADLAALATAARPVYSTLERNSETRRLIDAIRQLKARTPAAPTVAPCKPAPGGGQAPIAGQTQASVRIPNGIYRKKITEGELLDAGAAKSDAFNNYGTQTLTIKDGHWTYETRAPYRSPCSGAISYPDDRVRLTTDCGASLVGLVLSAKWTLEGGELRFLDAVDGSGRSPEARVLFGGGPWRKIG